MVATTQELLAESQRKLLQLINLDRDITVEERNLEVAKGAMEKHEGPFPTSLLYRQASAHFEGVRTELKSLRRRRNELLDEIEALHGQLPRLDQQS